MVFVILPHFSWQAHEVAAACGEQNHLGWQSRQARPRAKGRASGPSVIQCLANAASPRTLLQQRLRHTASRDYVAPLNRLSLA
jgi:hypothetical protein